MQGLSLRFNPVLKLLTFSDVFLWAGYYMMNATVAIYLEQKFGMDSIETISAGFAVYLVSRSIMMIPVAEFLDKHKTYVDETWAIAMGCFLSGICIYMYIFITQPWHLYLIQIFFGFAIALNLPAWRKAMAKFIDKGYEATEYTIYDIINSLLIAAMTAIGGVIVKNYGGFTALFVVAGSVAIIGAFVSMYLLKNRRIQHEYRQ